MVPSTCNVGPPGDHRHIHTISDRTTAISIAQRPTVNHLMEPPVSRTRQVYQHLQDALPRFLSEMEQPEPLCFLDFLDDLDYSDTQIYLLYDRTNKRGTRMGNPAL